MRSAGLTVWTLLVGGLAAACYSPPPLTDDVRRDPVRVLGGRATLSEPGPAGDSAKDALARFSPVILQGRTEDIEDDENEADLFGEVALDAVDPKSPWPVIGVTRPTVYTSTREITIDGTRHLQLVYCWWYPRHPGSWFLDLEEGRLDGAMLRITLDAAGRPAIYETLMACGCFHAVYVSETLEAASREELGGRREPQKTYCVEHHVPDKTDFDVLGIVPGEGRPMVVLTAGSHRFLGVLPAEGAPDLSRAARLKYTTRPYEELERLPFSEGAASLFLENGLVRGGERAEGGFLAVAGVDNAGWPRHMRAMMIHFNEADFLDEGLLPRFLRIPRAFHDRHAPAGHLPDAAGPSLRSEGELPPCPTGTCPNP